MADVGKAVAYVLVVEGTHDVACIGVKLIVQIDLADNVHRVLQEVTVHTASPVRLLALDGQIQVERLGDAIFVGQIDNFVVRADIQVLVHLCIDIVHVLRCYHVAVLAQCKPPWTVLDGVSVCRGTVVVERQAQFLVLILARTILHGVVQTVHYPLQAAVRHVEACRLR